MAWYVWLIIGIVVGTVATLLSTQGLHSEKFKAFEARLKAAEDAIKKIL